MPVSVCNFCLHRRDVENVVCSVLSGLIIWKNHRSVMTVLDILHAKNASQTSSVDGVEMMIIQQLANVYMEISQVSLFIKLTRLHIFISHMWIHYFGFFRCQNPKIAEVYVTSEYVKLFITSKSNFVVILCVQAPRWVEIALATLHKNSTYQQPNLLRGPTAVVQMWRNVDWNLMTAMRMQLATIPLIPTSVNVIEVLREMAKILVIERK